MRLSIPWKRERLDLLFLLGFCFVVKDSSNNVTEAKQAERQTQKQEEICTVCCDKVVKEFKELWAIYKYAFCFPTLLHFYFYFFFILQNYVA